MTEITMPKLSDSMEEGTILKWLIADGQPVGRDDDLVEIETDKATMTYVSEADGDLRIVAAEGTTLPVGAVIAKIDVGTENAAEVGRADTDANADSGIAADANTDAPGNGTSVPGNGGLKAAASVVTSVVAEASSAATPLARRAATAHGIDLSELRGTGPRGRITRADVFTAAGVEPDAPPSRPQSPSPSGSKGDAEILAATRLQAVIARRMSQAKATIPEFEVQTEAIMDELIALRESLKPLIDEGAAAPSINDFIIRACALALRRHPRVNASYEDGEFHLHTRVNVGFAVARDDALIVPTVYDADLKALATIATEARQLADRVRSGAVTPPELSGATFTVSNLGMYGMTAIRPVINPPQAAILGVGSIREILARVDGEIVDRRLMTLTLSSDHRILYGADAARFLAEVRGLLESPLRLIL
jgi:pyruvate dehydrogenase E2 component (dihydrolipoamide acetyltransferase)